MAALSGVGSLGHFQVKQARASVWTDVGGREAALVQRCAAGEEAAFAELLAEHERMVIQLAINLLGDRDEALDLSQDVFLRVFRTIHRFRGQSSLRTWIYRIAVNQARNRHRFWRRRHRKKSMRACHRKTGAPSGRSCKRPNGISRADSHEATKTQLRRYLLKKSSVRCHASFAAASS